MANDYFQFKQFKLNQEQCAMKVGTDGVLLGAWAGTGKVKRILDIGTGSGLVALMLAQRFNAIVDAVEIDSEAAKQAEENFFASKWCNQIKVIHNSFQQFAVSCQKTYDLIVSNPPYFTEETKSPNAKRAQARHADSLNIATLINLTYKLLRPDGKIVLVIPYNRRTDVIDSIINNDLWVLREAFIRPNEKETPNRLLIELGYGVEQQVHRGVITIESDTRYVYHPTFKKLTQEFYLG